MKYFTKEWFCLMQKAMLPYRFDEVLPDGEYSDEEIQALFDKQLKKHIEEEREDYDTPPETDWELWKLNGLDPDNFDPDRFAFLKGGIPPKTYEEARALLIRDRELELEEWKNRPPYDPKEDIKDFQKSFSFDLKMVPHRFPKCVTDIVDPRILALGLITESAYKLYKAEQQRIEQEYEAINEEGDRVLAEQDIPEEIKSRFRFHDADTLALRKSGKDLLLYMRNEYMWTGEKTPYVKVIFKNVKKINREKGLSIRPTIDKQGKLFCWCQFLYHELYRTEKGYEVHIMLMSSTHLRYLTVECEDIEFEEDITIEEIRM